MTLELHPVRHLRERTDDGTNVQHPSEESASGFLGFAAFVTGMSMLFDRLVPIDVGGISPTFLLTFAFAALGWWSGVTEPIFRRYLRFASLFVLVGILSLVVNGGLAVAPVADLLWFTGVAGMATLLQQPRLSRAMLRGFLVMASFLLLVVVLRLAAGLPAADGLGTHLLGLNRNAVDLCVVWLIPVVAVSKTFRLPMWGRWAFLAASVVWLVSSKGRTGLISLVLAPLLLFALKPPRAGGSRVPRLFVVVAAALLVSVGVGTVKVPWLPALNRIERVENEQSRSQSDEIRLLLNKKAEALGRKHPVVGVGFGQFEGQYDPILDTAKTRHIREKALVLPAHNTYLDAFATTGVTGFLLFIGTLAVPLIAGIRRSDDPDVRAITAGYAIALFGITFHTVYGTLIYLPAALLLAAVARAERQRRQAAISA